MEPSTDDMLRAVEAAVNCLVHECRKNGPIYARNPKGVAQVSRTGKWHLNAIAKLRKILETPCDLPQL